MRGSLPALVIAALVGWLGLLGAHIGVWERQRTAQQAALDLQQKAMARHQAEWKAWRERPRPQPGQPPAPPPVFQPLPAVNPPVFFPWWLFVFPLLMGPAAYAAAAEQRRLRKLQDHEEQEQTPYCEEELMENWEFKIIRCPAPLFDQPAFLAAVLQEEARGGWQLLEKFDGMRVRLKRLAGRPPASDLPAGYDPYRTAVGPGFKLHVLLWVLCVGCLALVLAFVVFQQHDPIAPPTFWALVAAAAGGAVVLALFAAVQTAKYRRLGKPAAAGPPHP